MSIREDAALLDVRLVGLVFFFSFFLVYFCSILAA